MRLSVPVSCLVLLVLLADRLSAQTSVIELNFNNSNLTNSGSETGITFSNSGAVTFGTGVSGNGAIFTGTASSSLSSSASPAFNNFTITLWMNTSVANGQTSGQWYGGAGLVDHELGGSTNDWGISQMGTKVAFGVGASDTTLLSSATVNTGQWVFVAATWNGSTGAMQLFVNNTLQSFTTSGPTGTRNTSAFLIGRDANNNNPTSFYSGSLDEIRLYDSVLSNAALAEIYASAVPEPSTYATLVGVSALAFVAFRRRTHPLAI